MRGKVLLTLCNHYIEEASLYKQYITLYRVRIIFSPKIRYKAILLKIYLVIKRGYNLLDYI